MSGTQVQYLSRQVARKDAQIRVLLAALEGAEMEKDLVASVACAFAFDFQATEEARYGGDHSSSRIALDMWDEAVKAVGG